jgi:hypothetical protein
MPIPPLKRESVERALAELVPKLTEIAAGPHQSTRYDLLWNGMRFPPKVVISKAVEIQYGHIFMESEFSGGEDPGHANDVLRKLLFEIVEKIGLEPSLPLELHRRYGRKAIYAMDGVVYDQQQQHLNRGLSPKCNDGGFFIFVTIDKEQLDAQHDYEDELYADRLVWISRRDVSQDDPDYQDLRQSGVRVSLFVRNGPRERFVYAGELSFESHRPFKDPKSGRPQIRFLWKLKQQMPDNLLQELTLGKNAHGGRASRQQRTGPSGHSRMPKSFDEFRKAFSYAVGAISDRIVVPEHHNYQVCLARFLQDRGISVEMERDFVDVAFALNGKSFIGEIKVTRNLTIPQAFRTALGQVIEYAHLLFPEVPNMIIFLDQALDFQRVTIATTYSITVIALVEGKFRVLNCSSCPPDVREAILRDYPTHLVIAEFQIYST